MKYTKYARGSQFPTFQSQSTQKKYCADLLGTVLAIVMPVVRAKAVASQVWKGISSYNTGRTCFYSLQQAPGLFLRHSLGAREAMVVRSGRMQKPPHA